MLLSSPACRTGTYLAAKSLDQQPKPAGLKSEVHFLLQSKHGLKLSSIAPEAAQWRRMRKASTTRAAAVSTDERPSSAGSSSNAEEGREEETGVVIVGAGLAGLAAARQLAQANVPFLLLEASDGVGGRVRTDLHQGFKLDRGFQLLLSGYPETQEVLDYEALDLQKFYAGAMVKLDKGFHRLADPFRHPVDGILSIFNPLGSLLDKLLIGIVRLKASSRTVEDILNAEEESALQRLKREGFSQSMIDAFFRPFFGGVFFDFELTTSSRLFEFIFRAFALGSNVLPAGGMGAIPQQLADRLPEGAVRLRSRATSLVLDGTPGVKLESGAIIRSRHGVVIAVEAPEAARLLGDALLASDPVTRPPRNSITLYYSADQAPYPGPLLYLNGSGKGVVNSVVVVSNVAPSYAPPGKSLMSVTVRLGAAEWDREGLEEAVRQELAGWFGASVVAPWQFLRSYKVVFGQPNQDPPTDLARGVRLGQKLYVCGDHRDHATTHGALVSGKRAAQALLADAILQSRAL